MYCFDRLYFKNKQAENDERLENSHQSYKCKLHNKSKERNCASFYAKLCYCFSLIAQAIEPSILNRRLSVSNIEIANLVFLK